MDDDNAAAGKHGGALLSATRCGCHVLVPASLAGPSNLLGMKWLHHSVGLLLRRRIFQKFNGAIDPSKDLVRLIRLAGSHGIS